MVEEHGGHGAHEEVMTPGNATSHHTILTDAEYLAHSWVRPVYLYINPILGILANTFCFSNIIYRKLFRKSPVFVFFMFLAFTDLTYDVAEGLLTNEYLLGGGLVTHYDVLCKVVLWLTHAGMVASIWILISVTSYKLYGMIRPLEIIKQDKGYVPYVICVGIVFVVYGLQLRAFWTTGVMTEHVSAQNITLIMCHYPDHHFNMKYTYVLMAFYSLVPGCILVVLSGCICAAFIRSYLHHKRLTQDSVSKGSSTSSTYKSAKNSIAMLLPLAFIHIMCTFPVILYVHVYGKVHESPEIHYLTHRLWVLNHSMNVYVQLIVSRFYREAMFPCLIKPSSVQ